MKFIYTFGLNEDGQCGQHSSEKVTLPKLLKLTSPIEIVSISAGSRHSLALSSTGVAFSWGWGHVGQLGHGDFSNVHFPKRIEFAFGEQKVICVSAGGMHSACITADNYCYAWGSNTYGQLGIGATCDEISPPVHNKRLTVYKEFREPARCIPRRLDHPGEGGAPYQFSKISCGGMHTAAINMQGQLYCWGKADNGQIGYSMWYMEFSPAVLSPKHVVTFPGKVVDVSCGGFYTLMLSDKGLVYAMGKEDFGCLGASSSNESMTIGMEKPTLIEALKSNVLKFIRAAGWHSCFLTNDGDLYVCGKGEYGRLGLGDEVSKMTPTLLTSNVKLVSGGGSHTIWCDSQDQIYSCGRLDGGRCGVGETKGDRLKIAKNITQNFMPGFTVVQLEAGGSHSIVLVDYPSVSVTDIPAFYAQFDGFQSSR